MPTVADIEIRQKDSLYASKVRYKTLTLRPPRKNDSPQLEERVQELPESWMFLSDVMDGYEL